MSTPDDYTHPCVLQDGHTVSATMTGSSGNSISATLDLDTVVGNVNGALAWGGSSFSNGAQNIRMDDGFTLTADLPDSNGNMVHSELIMGAGLDTHDGQDAIRFAFLPPYSQAHAEADNNSAADAATHDQVASANNALVATETLIGNAADYWPEGNAPAAGSSHSKQVATDAYHVASHQLAAKADETIQKFAIKLIFRIFFL
jgi:hypothetical protein